MSKWSKKIEDDLTLLIKDWLKQQNKTQKDLRRSLNASSERMPILIGILQKEYSQGGLPKLVSKLCAIENDWATNNNISEKKTTTSDPFGQLDLLLEELKEDCSN